MMEELKQASEIIEKSLNKARKADIGYAREIIVEAVVDMLPTAGRDFDVIIVADGDDSFKATLSSKTRIGKIFIEAIHEDLYNVINNIGD